MRKEGTLSMTVPQRLQGHQHQWEVIAPSTPSDLEMFIYQSI